ncbi:MAG: YicC family protein [Mariniblastus sp.]|nr:YicC family protein [Mariniblastus sp.]
MNHSFHRCFSPGVNPLLLSMTGHGQAVAENEHVHVIVELRSVNNRYLKTSISSELDPGHESQIESLIRDKIKRGAINARIKLLFQAGSHDYQINQAALQAYQRQLSDINSSGVQASLDTLLSLPGVIEENAGSDRLQAVWPVVQQATQRALETLIEMRAQEGLAMQKDLLANCNLITQFTEQIEVLAPNIVKNYSKRITDRINQMLQDYNVTVTPSDVIREVGIFAERVDISEEIVRLKSHVDQFKQIIDAPTSNGRKLDFLTQELLRETNTVGSKANDAAIANHVVEIKAAIERIREMVQNVE